MKRKILILLLLLPSILLLAQDAGTIYQDEYISPRNYRELNLPQFDLSLTIPRSAIGFAVPAMYGKDVAMHAEEKSYYCWSPVYFADGAISCFSFADEYYTGNALHLYITQCDEATKQMLDTLSGERFAPYLSEKYSLKDADRLPALKTDMGESFSYKKISTEKLDDDKWVEKQTLIHEFYKDGYLFRFSYDRDVDDDEPFYEDELQYGAYDDIIKNARFKDQSAERNIYEHEKDDDFYNRKSHTEADSTEYIVQRYGIRTDNTLVPVHLSYPQIGMSFDIPADTKFTVKGRDVTNGRPDSIQIAFNISDFYSMKVINSQFYNTNATFQTDILRNDLDSMDVEGYLQQQKDMMGYYQLAETTIGTDSIPLKVLFRGAETQGILTFFMKIGVYVYKFDVLNYSLQNQDLVDQLFQSLKLTDGSSPKESLSSLIKLEKPNISKLDTIVVKKLNLGKTVNLDLAYFNASFSLPGDINQYKITRGGSYDLLLPNYVFDKSDFTKDRPLSIFTKEENIRLDVVYAPKPNNWAEVLTAEYEEIKSYKGLNQAKCGFVDVNGITWSVLIVEVEGSYRIKAETYLNDFLLSYQCYSADSQNAVDNFLSNLRTFKINE